MGAYVIVARTPTITEYLDLRRLSGLSEKTPVAAAAGLPVLVHMSCAVGVSQGSQPGGKGSPDVSRREEGPLESGRVCRRTGPGWVSREGWMGWTTDWAT